MYNYRKSLAALFGLALVVGLTVLFAPASTQGQGQGGPPTQNVNVVNNPTVQASDLYPARPFQKVLILQATPTGFRACTTLPPGGGLIIELVTARTFGSTPSEVFMVMTMETTAGGDLARHDIPLEKLNESPSSAQLAVAQPLRAYADAGTELCFVSSNFAGGPFGEVRASVSGQLAPAAPSPATPAQ